MELEATHIARRRSVRRPPEEGREPRHEPDVIALGIRSQAAQGHVIKHALAQRRERTVN